ncbi:hypothetical protein BH11MYX1_BH11MYX1_48740 [soil metagenome]
MQIKQPGLFSRGKLALGQPAPHITPDTLLQELSNAWAPRGFQVYKSALMGLDVALKKSAWTGIAIKIKQTNAGTELAYNAFMPSAGARLLGMGLIPILIINANAWKPLLRQFEAYAQASPYFTHGQLAGGQAQLPQAVANYPQGMPQQHAYPQGAPHQQQPQARAPQQYPCQQCGTSLQWVAEYQRWFCGRCQQYR